MEFEQVWHVWIEWFNEDAPEDERSWQEFHVEDETKCLCNRRFMTRDESLAALGLELRELQFQADREKKRVYAREHAEIIE